MIAVKQRKARGPRQMPNRDGSGDILDMLLAMTNETALRSPTPNARGEYDGYRGCGRDMIRRCVANGLVVSRGGMPADVLAEVVADRGGPVLSGDEFGTWFVETAVRGLNMRRDGLGETDRPADAWADVVWDDDAVAEAEPAASFPVVAEAPAWATEWLARTLSGAKLDYLCELVAWRYFGGAEPAEPAAPWGAKTRRRFDVRAARS